MKQVFRYVLIVSIALVFNNVFGVGHTSAELTVELLCKPDVAELVLGQEPNMIVVKARASEEVEFLWEKAGPGTLEGDATTREVTYRPPTTLTMESGEMTIMVTVTNSRQETAQAQKTFILKAPSTLIAPDASEAPPMPTPDLLTGKTYAVLIGVGVYRDPQISSFAFCENDAQALYALLTDPHVGNLPPEQVKLLRGADVTDRAIRRTLGTWLRKQTQADDTVIIYYTGRGVWDEDEWYWLPHDAERAEVFSTAISRTDVADMLAGIHARKIVTLLDVSYASAAPQAPASAQSPFDIFGGAGRIVLSASDGTQDSARLPEAQQGAFTAALLAGLRGEADGNADGVIMAAELWPYLERHFAAIANAAAVPVYQGDLSQDIALLTNTAVVVARRAAMQLELRKNRIIELYRQGQLSAEQFKRALDIVKTNRKDQILEDFLDEKITLDIFTETF